MFSFLPSIAVSSIFFARFFVLTREFASSFLLHPVKKMAVDTQINADINIFFIFFPFSCFYSQKIINFKRLIAKLRRLSLHNKKNSFRQSSKALLNSTIRRGTYQKDKSFERNLLLFVKKTCLKNILMFLPLSIEPSVKNVIKKLKSEGRRIYVPFIEDVSFKIVKYRLPIKQGAYNIQSPGNSLEFIKKIDLAIVPAIGIDSKFRRIGFGKGMYDRFFDSLNYKPLIVFVQRVLCFSKEEICEPHDVVGDYLLLPNKIFVKGRAKNAYNTVNSYGSRNNIRASRIFCSKKTGFRKISNLHRAIKIKSQSDRARG
jgi:5-formyltetrahydrofolate cyclo-ligase